MFTTPILLQAPFRDGDPWMTVEPLNFRSQTFTYPNGKPKNYVVPAGYSTDFASVPRLPIVYWLVGGFGAAAGIIHDWLYERGIKLKMIENRLEADLVFHEVLLACSVPPPYAWSMYYAVRMAGSSHFNYT